MKKIIPTMFCAAAVFGCSTTPVTPDESWADYNRYYSATGETAVPPAEAVDIRMVKSGQMDSNVKQLKEQGYVVLGSFKIADGTEISHSAVSALAKKLNASAVVWSTVTTSSHQTSLPNPDMGIVGVNSVEAVRMTARRPDESFSEQTMHQHTLYMLGKKQ